jgi:meso-butanediol dehydrogenase / (S,S)-butanediol dehydrogenase / diacetyl reductase
MPPSTADAFARGTVLGIDVGVSAGMSDMRKVIVITGAGGALGAAISAMLATESVAGNGVGLVLSDVSEASLAATVQHVGDVAAGSGTVIEHVLADVADEAQVQAVVQRAVQRFGRLDVLISNAGVLNQNGRIHNLTSADWERSFRVNVMGAVNGIKAAVKVMRGQKSGSIILTASVAGMTAWSHSAPYCATKAAVIQLAKVAAVEYAGDGIRVNCVCPGTFRSAVHDGLPQQAIDAIAAKHPLGLGAAADLVGAYSYLASDASRWTTGSAMVVDGGYSAP